MENSGKRNVHFVYGICFYQSSGIGRCSRANYQAFTTLIRIGCSAVSSIHSSSKSTGEKVSLKLKSAEKIYELSYKLVTVIDAGISNVIEHHVKLLGM